LEQVLQNTDSTTARSLVAREIVPRVNRFRTLQVPEGPVVRDRELAATLLREVQTLVRRACDEVGMPTFAQAFDHDTERWLRDGLDGVPGFDACEAEFAPPANGGLSFFTAPMLATNGPAPRGKFLECFLIRREEPDECRISAERYPHPKNLCQSARLLAGSDGIATGNCIVFFPENIATSTRVERQSYAMFFFNKFQRIYLNQTMPRVRRLFGERDLLFGEPAWVSAGMEPAACYRARCVWGYLHDRFHHCGAKPFDVNIRVKMNWFVGLLEEIKVDCQSAIALLEGGLPFHREIFEFIRMLRYPGQPDATTNFDAGTGVFLFEWLFRAGAISPRQDGMLHLDLESCLAGMHELVAAVEEIEGSVQDDAEYRQRAKSLVRDLLPEGETGTRFALPESFARYARITPEDELLEFHELPY
jgi:hypothetical protein